MKVPERHASAIFHFEMDALQKIQELAMP